jgi:hypothetical protein
MEGTIPHVIDFQSLAEAVNAEAFAWTGARDTCVLSAHVFAQVGVAHAYPLRVEATIHHPTDRGFHGAQPASPVCGN